MPCDLGLHPGFCIGPIPVRLYGIIIVSAALIGGFIATREARRLGENTDRIWDALIFIVIAGIRLDITCPTAALTAGTCILKPRNAEDMINPDRSSAG